MRIENLKFAAATCQKEAV